MTLGHFGVYSGKPQYWQQVQDIRTAHTMVKNTDVPIFSEILRAYLIDIIFDMLGSFNEKPIPLHQSPLMTRDSSGADTRKTNVGLRWPKGASVNAGVVSNSYRGTDFNLSVFDC